MARRSTRKAAGVGPSQRAESSSAAVPARRVRGVVVVSAVAVLIAGGVVGGLLLTAASGSKHVTAPRGNSIKWSTVPELQTAPPPWPSQSNLLASRLVPAG